MRRAVLSHSQSKYVCFSSVRPRVVVSVCHPELSVNVESYMAVLSVQMLGVDSPSDTSIWMFYKLKRLFDGGLVPGVTMSYVTKRFS